MRRYFQFITAIGLLILSICVLSGAYYQGSAPSKYGFLTNDVVWDDLRATASQVRLGATAKPDFDYTNLGLLYPSGDSAEVGSIILQIPHDYKLESSISPHVHFIQFTSLTPTFKMDYRITENNAIPGNYTTVTFDNFAYEYPGVGNSIQQIVDVSGDIDMTGIDSISAIIDVKLYRDDSTYSADTLVKEFDIHYQRDSGGSREEYTK